MSSRIPYKGEVTTSELEVERKYDVEPGADLPRLDDVAGVVRVDRPVVGRLEATYFDTRDLTLAGAGITVRRRVGGDDQGWHLKVPGAAEDERVEMHLPLARAIRTVPKEFRTLLEGVAGLDDDNLQAVARLRTMRTVRVLRDDEGRPLAEVCDDEVEARAFPVLKTGDRPRPETSWREWEVELVDGDADLLDAVEQELVEAGARPSRHSSKLRRALEALAPWPVTTPDEVTDVTTPAGVSASGGMPSPREVVGERIAEQSQRIIRLDPAVRRDSPDAVHQMRVAARRLRSALATYRPMLRKKETEPLREELRHLGRVLGDARDLEVLDERLSALVQAEGWEGHPFTAHLAGEVRGDRERAHRDALSEMDSSRHQALLTSLQQLTDSPPWAEELDWDEVLKRVRKDYERARRRMRAADDADSHQERLRLLHETRKAAKRWRYAAETLEPAYGRTAGKLAESATRLQSHLGNLQDARLGRERLGGAAERAEAEGVGTFPAGVLWAREDETMRTLEAEVPRVWRKASRKKRRKWLAR